MTAHADQHCVRQMMVEEEKKQAEEEKRQAEVAVVQTGGGGGQAEDGLGGMATSLRGEAEMLISQCTTKEAFEMVIRTMVGRLVASEMRARGSELELRAWKFANKDLHSYASALRAQLDAVVVAFFCVLYICFGT